MSEAAKDPVVIAAAEKLVEERGKEVRTLKESGADKPTIGAAVKLLVDAKKSLAAAKGEEFDDGKKKKKDGDKTKKGEAGINPKEARAAKRLAEQNAIQSGPTGPINTMIAEQTYGTFDIITSAFQVDRKFTPLAQLTDAMVGETVWCRGSVHNIRDLGNSAFVILRHGLTQLQASVFQDDAHPAKMIKWIGKISRESIVDVQGTIAKAEVQNASIKTFELQISKLFVVDRSAPMMPFQLEDAMRANLVEDQFTHDAALEEKGDAEKKDEKDKKGDAAGPTVDQDTRLNFRWIDLRTLANQGVFRFASAVGAEFRAYWLANGFTEIHSPKLISTASEGGADVFKLGYFGGSAFLAQSPQLYKQMALMGGLQKVFEIGPVFRAENSNTNRHLTEFVGLDMEMEFCDHYHEVLDFMDGMFIAIFDQLNGPKYKELREAVWSQFPAEPLKYNKPTTRITFPEAVKMLQAAGCDQDPFEDLSSANERKLGELVKEQFNGTDFYILDKFPTAARPFYTMPDPDDKRYSNSYDIFVRGQEIMSGAQRIHDADLLVKRSKEMDPPVDLSPIQAYVDCFKNGAPPHGGGGIGLERITMLFLGLTNIRRASMFPRDPKRLTP